MHWLIKPVSLAILFLAAIGLLWVLQLTFDDYGRSEWIYYEDIFYVWSDSDRVAQLQNPYDRIAWSDMRHNYKFPTYFPLFYELGAIVQRFIHGEFLDWLAFWRPVFFIFDLAIGLLLFTILERRGLTLIGVLGALYWWFNRWTLDVSKVSHIDFLPIFFMLLAMSLWPRARGWALLSFSLSLALKQIGVFLVPLFLLWSWQARPHKRVRHITLSAALLASLPTLSAIPFLRHEPLMFAKSMLFSLTRLGDSHAKTMAVGEALGFEGFPARALMLGLIALVVVLSAQRRIGMYLSAMLVMLIFADFNPVSFRQYVCWYIVFVPLLAADRFADGSPADFLVFKRPAHTQPPPAFAST